MSSRLANPALSSILGVQSTDRGDGEDRLETEVVAFFDRFRVPLLRYLLGFGLAVPDGEEVLQEVFLSLFQHLRRGKPRENLPGWLFRVAHNLALKKCIQTRRDLGARVETGIEDVALDPSPNPEDQLVTTETRQRLLAVVRALPEQDRRCLVLRAEGLRYRELARILGMSLGAVSLSLARSLGRIARAAER
jgi:RNA polymerase sigma-70 factor (ECF subfamily)